MGNHERLPWTQCLTERDGCLAPFGDLVRPFRNLQNGEDHEPGPTTTKEASAKCVRANRLFHGRGRGNATTSDPPNLHDGRFRGAGALPDDVGDEEQQQSTPDGGGQQLGFGLVDLALDLIRQLAEPGLEVVSSDLGVSSAIRASSS